MLNVMLSVVTMSHKDLPQFLTQEIKQLHSLLINTRL
jgi:hypothetical protein